MHKPTWILGATLLAASLSAGPARAGQIVYGVDDSNNIVKVDLGSGVVGSWSTGTSASESNGLALDAANNRLLFRADYNSGPFYQFDLATNTSSALTSLPGSFGSVSSATFVDGGYYYVADGTASVRKLTFNSTAMTGNTTPIAGFTSPGLSFGDLAVSTANILYGSASQGGSTILFALDLNTSTYQSYTSAAITSTGLLQIAMNADGTGLVGHSHNSGNWYNVSFTGGISQIAGLNTVGLRDIASLATPVPEPGSVVMMGLGGLGLVGYGLRKRRQAAATA